MSPVSGIPSRDADTAKPLTKPTSNPASAINRADIASWQPGITMIPGFLNLLRNLSAALSVISLHLEAFRGGP
jgi:hypothetical protein